MKNVKPEEQLQYLKVLKHRELVGYALQQVADNIQTRANYHDLSKLSEHELPLYAKYVPEYSGKEYGTPEYKAVTEKISVAGEHHDKSNRHHLIRLDPSNVSELNMFDILEIIADWYAVNYNKKTDIRDFLKIQKGITDPILLKVIENTVPFFMGKMVYENPDQKYIMGIELEELPSEIPFEYKLSVFVMDKWTDERIDSTWICGNLEDISDASGDFLYRYIDESILVSDSCNVLNSVLGFGKYKIIDLSSLLIGKGYDPDLDRFEFVGFNDIDDIERKPIFESWTTALMYNRLTKGY